MYHFDIDELWKLVQRLTICTEGAMSRSNLKVREISTGSILVALSLYPVDTFSPFRYIMPFERFVETGRVAYVSDGPHKGKLVTIVDVIDQNRVLVDGPTTNVPRGEMRLSQLHLTKFCLRFPYTASTRVVRKAWDAGNIDELWKKTMWARKVEAKKKRASLSDFDRFKLRKARQIRNKLRTDAFFKLKKKAKKSKPMGVSKTTKKAEKK